VPAGCSNWLAATNADVSRDSMVARFNQMLAMPVGTSVSEVHNGRLWRLDVVGPGGGHTKDVRGYVCAAAPQPGPAPMPPAPGPGPAPAPLPIGPTAIPEPPFDLSLCSAHLAWSNNPTCIRNYQSALTYLSAVRGMPAWNPQKIDGFYGPFTAAAVKAFQTWAGLTPDGQAGTNTANAIQSAIAGSAPGPAPGPAPMPPAPGPMMTAVARPQVDLSSCSVHLAWQNNPTCIHNYQTALTYLATVHNNGAFNPGRTDGVFDPPTMAAVKAFQQTAGLTADGKAGTQTAQAIMQAMATASGSAVSGAVDMGWVAATSQDVARDGTTRRYVDLVRQPVGYAVQEMHNGRLWKFNVVNSHVGKNVYGSIQVNLGRVAGVGASWLPAGFGAPSGRGGSWMPGGRVVMRQPTQPPGSVAARQAAYASALALAQQAQRGQRPQQGQRPQGGLFNFFGR